MMFPRMIRAGWDRRYIGAVLAAAAPLGMYIPPSINAIMFSTIANASVPVLFVANIVPGVVWAALMMIINRFYYKKWYHPENADETIKQELRSRVETPTPRIHEIGVATKQAIPALIMPLIILGGIYSGVFTTTEAGGVAGLYSIIAGIVLFRTISWKDTWNTFSETSKDLGVILFIVATSAIFSRIMVIHGVPEMIAKGMITLADNPIIVILIIDLIFLIAGCFFTPPVIMFIITPLILPTAREIGLNEIQFAMMLFVSIGVGVLTPPMAGNLFVSARMAKCSVSDILRPVMPYLFFCAIPTLLLVSFVPGLSTWLPGIFGLLG